MAEKLEFPRTNKGAISPELFSFIKKNLPKNSTILEFGSGEGTRELIKAGYNMISIEHNKEWAKYDSKYYIAPLDKETGWYDIDVVAKAVQNKYALILIDGPPANGKDIEKSRWGFFRNIDLIRPMSPIIVDDIDRPEDYKHMLAIANTMGRDYDTFRCKDRKMFGVIK